MFNVSKPFSVRKISENASLSKWAVIHINLRTILNHVF
ncbi:hypothetical protein BSSX_0571 [Bacillus subtilis]|nr:hypothetical protein BSSX_0571 [Bacillus subtilis]